MTTNRPPRNLAGTREYPVLAIFKEKHDTLSYLITSDEEMAALAVAKIRERAEDNWYPTVEEATRDLRRAQVLYDLDSNSYEAAQAAAEAEPDLPSYALRRYQQAMELTKDDLKYAMSAVEQAKLIAEVLESGDAKKALDVLWARSAYEYENLYIELPRRPRSDKN